MQWFLDLSVRAKCSVAMGLMVVLLGAVSTHRLPQH